MEEIEKRLRESTDAFIKSFENWVAQNKNLESRETLMESMHEVRKVVSRVEIEIAISERDRLGSRPLPIPPHRSQRRANANEGGEGEEIDYNTIDDGNDGPQPDSNSDHQPRRSGGGGGERRPRRPMQNRDRGNNNNQQGQ